MGNKIWQNLDVNEKIASAQAVARSRGIYDQAVEKDWWVTAVLKALYNTECAQWLNFKGGTSLSKGWSLINRFSEDIDLSISREFFLSKLNLHYAKAENNTQLKNLRKASRDYIHGKLSAMLDCELRRLGISGFSVRNITEVEQENGLIPISHDSDPTVVYVDYNSIFQSPNVDITPHIKIEISCLSMDEPYEIRQISSMLNEQFGDIDCELTTAVRTVTPTRTFLEKAFLLAEEFQKDKPRSRRMSRHLYDLERIMDTDFGKAALEDAELYKAIVHHREKFYHLGYVDYSLDYPNTISFVPSDDVLKAYRTDYDDNMIGGYIYGEAISFDDLMVRMAELQCRFRSIEL
jgi:hypothetical protein